MKPLSDLYFDGGDVGGILLTQLLGLVERFHEGLDHVLQLLILVLCAPGQRRLFAHAAKFCNRIYFLYFPSCLGEWEKAKWRKLLTKLAAAKWDRNL